MKEEKLVDVLGFEGYYKISETGKIYKIRPNLSCGYDILREVKPIVCNKGKKNESTVVSLTRNGTRHTIVYRTLYHDSFFPERKGLKCKFNGNVSLDNIVLLDRRRPSQDGITERLIVKVLTQTPNMHISEMSKICMVCEERINQVKRKLNKCT